MCVHSGAISYISFSDWYVPTTVGTPTTVPVSHNFPTFVKYFSSAVVFPEWKTLPIGLKNKYRTPRGCCIQHTPFVVNSQRQKTSVPPISQPWKSRQTHIPPKENHEIFRSCFSLVLSILIGPHTHIDCRENQTWTTTTTTTMRGCCVNR